MITQITIDNIASYKSKNQLNTDKKVNIIYGLNGSGKSTFSNYFYSPANIEYQHCSHIGEYDLVLVYNQKFIQDNFHAKDTLNGIFSLSKENKIAQQKIEEILLKLKTISEIKKKLQTDIIQQRHLVKNEREKAQNKIWEIKTNYTGGDRVLEFCLRGKMGSKEILFNYLCSINLPINKPTKTITDIKIAANAINGDAAIKHSLLSRLNDITLTLQDLDSLNEIIIGSNDSPISDLIRKLENSDWVSEGLKYIDQSDKPQCPFCQSYTITEHLTKQINEYFDDSYKNNLLKIRTIYVNYESKFKAIPKIDDYKESPFSANYLVELSEIYIQLCHGIEENLELIKEKNSNPSSQVQLKNLSQYFESFNCLVDSINKLIIDHNQRIDNADAELEKIKNEFWSILRYEYDQTISNFNTVNNNANKIILQKDGDHTLQKNLEISENEQLAIYQKSTVNIQDAIDNINEGLVDIGITDFYIEKYEKDLYRIVRTNANSKIFSSLSEGEKMIISFLYFRELLRGKQSSTEGQVRKIAVIDDPVSSLSHIFVYNIGRLLKNDFFNSPNLAQIFVLTHSLYFFYELTETRSEIRHANQKLFRLSKNSNGSSINTMKYEEIQNDYQSYWSVINDDKQPPALIANCMRNIIEYFFNFVQKADLSNVAQKPELQNIKFQSFLRYINRESHSLGQNIFDFKEFNYNDFKDGLKLVFEHTGYSDHYKKMSKINT